MRSGTAWWCMEWLGAVRSGKFAADLVRFGAVWQGAVRLGRVL
jgi:hypothetical protein